MAVVCRQISDAELEEQLFVGRRNAPPKPSPIRLRRRLLEEFVRRSAVSEDGAVAPVQRRPAADHDHQDDAEK